jgi:Sulfotransferase family
MTASLAARPEGTGMGTDSRTAAAPVVILTYGFTGVSHLQAMLDREPSLACTTGTGILPACHRAALAWEQAEDRVDEPRSALATASLRALVGSMLTTIASRTGRHRWCETATADPEVAETFLSLFPATRFICLHRACPAVVRAIIQASPWGLAGQTFAAYTVTHPRSTAAAVGGWWADHASSILDFEHAHPQSCLRVRYEDLVLDRGPTAAAIRAFLGLAPDPGTASWLAEAEPSAPGSEDADPHGPGSRFPSGQLPPQLASWINELHEQLGYPPLPAPGPPGLLTAADHPHEQEEPDENPET